MEKNFFDSVFLLYLPIRKGIRRYAPSLLLFYIPSSDMAIIFVEEIVFYDVREYMAKRKVSPFAVASMKWISPFFV